MLLDLVPAETLFNPTIGGSGVHVTVGNEKRFLKVVKRASEPEVGSLGRLQTVSQIV